MPDPDLALGQALADVATIGILQEQAIRRGEVVTEQLQPALNSRVVIEQAKGVLAQHHGLPIDVAFRPAAADVRELLGGKARKNVVTLSIDDGPHPDWTPQVLDLLAENEVRATFSLVGGQAQAGAGAHPGRLERRRA